MPTAAVQTCQSDDQELQSPTSIGQAGAELTGQSLLRRDGSDSFAASGQKGLNP